MTIPQTGPNVTTVTTETNNDGIKVPSFYTLVRETKYETNDFRIIVGWVNDKELPQYLVVNKTTDVVEASNEVLVFMRQWIAHFQQEMDNIDAGKTSDPPSNVAQAFN